VIKRTIEISREPAYLTTQHKQLVLKRDGQIVGSIPCEDLGMVVVDHPRTTYSHAALTSLVESAATVVICGRDHLPQGILLPFGDHTEVVWRIHDQIAVRVPLRKRLWKQLVQAKILAQARNLAQNSAPRRKLVNLARAVRSGDPANLEAQAARVYWSAWLINPPEGCVPDEVAFSRDPDGRAPNSMLNYGYAIVRAAVARALVAAGLLPALGLHHSNRSNAFCLADDLMEPLRPLVDARVRVLHFAGRTELDQPTKAALLELLTLEVRMAGREQIAGPLMVALHRMIASLVRCYSAGEKRLEIPVPCTSRAEVVVVPEE
jgi:CRISPR-associated protein Cas1